MPQLPGWQAISAIRPTTASNSHWRYRRSTQWSQPIDVSTTGSVSTPTWPTRLCTWTKPPPAMPSRARSNHPDFHKLQLKFRIAPARADNCCRVSRLPPALDPQAPSLTCVEPTGTPSLLERPATIGSVVPPQRPAGQYRRLNGAKRRWARCNRRHAFLPGSSRSEHARTWLEENAPNGAPACMRFGFKALTRRVPSGSAKPAGKPLGSGWAPIPPAPWRANPGRR